MARSEWVVRGLSALARYLLSAPWADMRDEVERLEALGPAPRANVDAIEAAARADLARLQGRLAEPTVCARCGETGACDCTRVGGVLGEGD